jgi:hypothetical protein
VKKHERRARFAFPLVRALLPLVLALPGCHAAYVAPSASEPHALLKVRVVYHQAFAGELTQRVSIGGALVPVLRPSGTLSVPETTAVRVAPAPFTLEVASEFARVEARLVTLPVQVPYPPGCVQPGAPNLTGSPLCTRMRVEYQTRTVSERVPIASCVRALGLVPQAGEELLVQYDFEGPGRCALHCRAGAPGSVGGGRPCVEAAAVVAGR